MPYTAAARNFGFSKNAFELIGGYENTKDTKSGDDDLLLREAVKQNMKIGIVTRQDAFVYSETKKTFSGIFAAKSTAYTNIISLSKKASTNSWILAFIKFVFFIVSINDVCESTDRIIISLKNDN